LHPTYDARTPVLTSMISSRKDMNARPKLRPETLAARGLHPVNPATGAVGAPLQPASTYARDEEFRLIGSAGYSRDENPTYLEPESVLAALEEGEAALLYSSGIAAATAVLQALRPGDHIVAMGVMYFEIREWMRQFCSDWGLLFDLFDPADPDSLMQVVRPGQTKLLWIESPTNPTWDIIDITWAADIAHEAGAHLVVDSTVATPVLTRPLTLGADLVVHSATKYLNGHGDVVAGAVVTRSLDEFWARVRQNRVNIGSVIGPFEAWLLARGMRTLHLRVRQASENALAIALHFHGHDYVAAVLYPGLENHPGHEIACRQMDGGFGGMISLRIKGGAKAALAVCGACQVWVRASSLGGTESLISHRASIEPESPVPHDLLRLSVGIEHIDDLVTDLERALAVAGKVSPAA
jgi:cystathionine gamma-synthase